MKLYQNGAGALAVFPSPEWTNISRRMLVFLGAVGAALALSLILVLLLGAMSVVSVSAVPAFEGAPHRGVELLPLGPVNPKHEILKSLMWDMRFAPVLGYLPMASISHLRSHISHPHLNKGMATQKHDHAHRTWFLTVK